MGARQWEQHNPKQGGNPNNQIGRAQSHSAASLQSHDQGLHLWLCGFVGMKQFGDMAMRLCGYVGN